MATKLKIVCGWCGKDMGEKDGKGQTGVTAGMCEQCWERLFPGKPYPEEDNKDKEQEVEEVWGQVICREMNNEEATSSQEGRTGRD